MNGNKNIIIYFSRADENYNVGYIEKGNTEIVAEFIKELTGADMFKVERRIPYSRDYNTCLQEAKSEKELDQRPALARELESVAEYDTIYIGCPIYWGSMPQPMYTQLEKLNFKGKNIKVFTTHEGNGIGSVLNDLMTICVGANISDDAIAIVGSEAKDSKPLVEQWINKN